MTTKELVMKNEVGALGGADRTMASEGCGEGVSGGNLVCIEERFSQGTGGGDCAKSVRNGEVHTDIVDVGVCCNDGGDGESEAVPLSEAERTRRIHTFRKRRLTYSTQKPEDGAKDAGEDKGPKSGAQDMADAAAKVAAAMAAEGDIDSDDAEDSGGDRIENRMGDNAEADGRGIKRKPRDESVDGGDRKRIRTKSEPPKTPPRLRVIHAGMPPPSVARRLSLTDPKKAASRRRRRRRRSSVRRRKRRNPLFDDDDDDDDDVGETEDEDEEGAALPSWMKSQHTKDESKLPFPSAQVGTYSCHGLEPVFHDEQPQDDDDGDENYFALEEDDTIERDDGIEDEVESGNVKAAEQNGTAVAEMESETPDADSERTKSNFVGSTADGELLQVRPKKPTVVVQPAPPPTTAKINQDRGGVAFPYGNSTRTALFAAYDGHGERGELVSQFALHEIQKRLEAHPTFHSNVEKAFRDTFVEVDEALKDEPDVEPFYSGSTACVVLMRDRTLFTSNVGDSRAVLGRRSRQTPLNSDSESSLQNASEPLKPGVLIGLDLSVDQNPDSPGEQERIEGSGGYVSPPPEEGLSARVWLDSDCTQIGLAMSRSIGDHAVKSVGVIADPVVSQHRLTEDDEFLIVATDGVWEFISSAEAVNIVGKHLDAGEGSSKACQRLIEAAAERWNENEGDYRDDITAVVVRLKDLFASRQK